MSYLVIETFGGAEYAVICTHANGNNLVFEDRTEAEKEAQECQDGFVVELN